MSNKKFYICEKCGNMVEIINASGVNPVCCGQKMTALEAGVVEASREKHIPEVIVNNRLFKKYTGKTLHQTVIEEKIKVAKRILKEGNLSINEVAIELSFLDRSHFCTTFKKQTGFTPLEYKKSNV